MPSTPDKYDPLKEKDGVSAAKELVDAVEKNTFKTFVNERMKSVVPMRSEGGMGNKGGLNLYNDPVALFMDDKMYNAILFFCLVQSNSVLVLFRHRIGRRIMRGWIFQILFLFLISLAGLGNFIWLGEVNWLMALYAVSMGVLATYHHIVARELTAIKEPRDMLHTMARGDSHLMYFMDMMPVIRIPMWHFYYRKWKPKRILPFDEPTVQQILEPCICLILGIILSFNGNNVLGAWLVLSGVSLYVVEGSYHTGALNRSLDQFDQKIETRVLKEVTDAHNNNEERIRPKINGIATTSAQMLQILKEKNQQAEAITQNPET